MTNLIESSTWESGIYQLETDDPTLGGQPGFNMGEPVTGHANAQAQQLANRTSYLKSRIDDDLASYSDPQRGPAMVGFNPLLPYPSTTVGGYLTGQFVYSVTDGEILKTSDINKLAKSSNLLISGTPTVLSKPDYATLISTDSAGRLSLLEAYHPKTVILDIDDEYILGNVTFENLLITSSTGTALATEFRLTLTNCDLHGIGIKAIRSGSVNTTTSTVISDAVGVGIHVEQGGKVSASNSQVLFPASRGLYVQNNGVIFANDSKITGSGSTGIYVLYGGTVISTGSTINQNSGAGVLINYGGSININSSIIDDNAGSGVVSESNGAIYAVGAQITNNGDRGIQTVFGGIVQATNATITGNSNLAIQALRSGYVNANNATIDTTNNSGGTQISATGIGMVETEAPGTGGKTALNITHYNPGFNRHGNGSAYIGTAAQDDSISSVAANTFSTRKTVTISSDSITPTSTWQIVDTEAAAATDNLANITLGTNYPVHELYIQIANNARTVTVKHNAGNIRLAGGADVLLNNRNSVLCLVWNEAGSVWSQPL